MKKTKLLVCCHKESVKGDDLLVTVKAGAALGKSDIICDFSDDDGENISALNPSYNELTVLYWAWKNLEKLGSPDRIGLMHYRRYFYFDARRKDAVLKTSVPKELFREKARLSEEQIELLFRHGDFIAPSPSKRRSVYKQYALTQKIGDLDLSVRILKELFPEYGAAADEYLSGKDCYFYNMFVFPQDLFLRYAEFIFPILERFCAERGETGRLFISERLTGIFIHKLIQEGKRPVFLPVLYREGNGEGRLTRFAEGWKKSKGLKQKLLMLCRLIVKRRRESRRV